MKLIHVPIELLEERYSQQWFHWFDAEFKRLKIDTVHVLPTSGLNAKIVTGEFLDVIGTLEFKTEQLHWICSLFRKQEIDKDTVFLFADAWFPGIELLAYLRDALQIPFKIVGIFHAGTWDEHDFITKMGMRSWGQHCERAWFELLDTICVATNFHKRLIIENSSTIQKCHLHLIDKIKVTGLPIYPDFVDPQIPKENIVVFPHRLATEKNPKLFDQLKDMAQTQFPDWQFIKTKEYCTDKASYYTLLNKAKIAISFADQETFGISMLESVLCGCIPIVPNQLSYKELYPVEFKYSIEKNQCVSNALAKLQDVITYFEIFKFKQQLLAKQVQLKGAEAIDTILKTCLEIHNE